ncbi:MAG: acireductone synthase [Planctomycetota bacterium]|nr:acireductone synthase [Planctomycetota bacterium]
MSWQPIRGLLLDIEGTTSSISFVYDQMFPYVRHALRNFLVNGWQDAPVRAAVSQLSADAVRREAEHQVDSITTNRLWPENAETDERVACVVQHVLQLMDADVKATGLKQLQGLIWQAGFEQGELIAHVYDDVLPALQRWQRNGLDVRVYSSGSVLAQHLFFGHTIAGDLLPYFKGHYDTTIGGKKEPASYRRIADAFAVSRDLVCERYPRGTGRRPIHGPANRLVDSPGKPGVRRQLTCGDDVLCRIARINV